MPRIAYVNGRYIPHAEASVHVEDRGFQFADSVYEVCSVVEGHLLDEDGHIARLQRSLSELHIAEPMSMAALRHVLRQMVRRNRVRDGLVYLQVSRGVARRDHPFPVPDVVPSIVITARSVPPRLGDAKAAKGIAVRTRPDIRWGRVDIKTTGLLPNVLAMQEAKDDGADDAWLVDKTGHVTEGTRSNAWIVDKSGKLLTRYLDNGILGGITRTALFEVARSQGLEVEERAFTVEEAHDAREAFMTAATVYVMPVVRIDDTVLGNGVPGSVALALRSAYRDASLTEARRAAARFERRL